MQVDLCNGCKTVVVVTALYSVKARVVLTYTNGVSPNTFM